ncbi:Beta-1,4-N-acetylgalactosaminyltransferase 3-like [Oopsacas minuta]|uniref:Hexosyltransferase n=1 Tax=Oopsacas minuta TaxID=111878 RepID=A0AAV7KPX5_9METZ|nr:Beta-1,4-N-acetylgalactosaminyltransferase 3-like [Oopsacas minuta]
MNQQRIVIRCVVLFVAFICCVLLLTDKSRLSERMKQILNIDQIESIQRQLERFDSSFPTTTKATQYVSPDEVEISAEPYTLPYMRGWLNFSHKITQIKSRNNVENIPYANPVTTRKSQGYLEVYIWWESCYTSVNAFKAGLGFPFAPHVKLYTQSLFIRRGRGFYAERIFGYLQPINRGLFRFSLTTLDSVEVWLSKDSNPQHSLLIISTASKENTGTLSQESAYIMLGLESCYLEILHLVASQDDMFALQWKPPNHSNYTLIPSKLFKVLSTQTHLKLPSTLPMHLTHTIGEKHENRQASQLHRIPWKIYKDSFSACQDMDVFATSHILSQYYGVFELVYTKIYPDDSSQMYNVMEHKHKSLSITGNEYLPQGTIENIISLFSSQTYLAFSAVNLVISSVNSVEEKLIKGSKTRYLIDLTLKDTKTLEKYRFVDYLFMEGRILPKLCIIPNYHISPLTPFIYFIIIVKNLAQPLLAFILELEKLSYGTGDDKYGLIVVDFMSTDKNVSLMLSTSHLRDYKYISMSGPFIKVQGQNAALQSVNDNDVILFLCDLHLHLPSTILDEVRTHTIKGISAYAPVLFRLQCGHSLVNPLGFWEIWGSGLFALFRSDWLILGGMDTDKYSKSWGGEDSDLLDRTLSLGYEVERKALPGLAHFYHTHFGLWDE